ncbi:zinc-binding dehydrogenase [Frankia sp. R43]|uniref:zinc-dependent alcohol dehydrogenase n=1 Tax=Frankia sp. R43 TaxID=269536 RepID=UPI0006CA1742|nr:alcohol dehydrogenase catalytic domain-containing protein [Frankia sp. R43]
MTGRAVWIDAPGQLATRPAEPVAPGPGEVLVQVAWAGICGSDRELLRGTRPAGFVRYPVVPGHEWSGTVTAVGPAVDPGAGPAADPGAGPAADPGAGPAADPGAGPPAGSTGDAAFGPAGDATLVGRRVVAEGFRSCRICAACRGGDTNMCASPYDETGFTRPGAWSDHLVVPSHLLHVLPPDADLRAAAGLEPAACAAAMCLRAEAVPGERVAVVGAGTLGLLATQLLAAGGPAELVAVDPRVNRGRLAARCGATTLLTPDEAAAAPWARHFDVVVEAAGAAGSAVLACGLARRGGRVVLAGLAADGDHPLRAIDLVLPQLTVHTVFGAPSRAWSHAVRAFAAGHLDPAALVTHELPLDDVGAAFRLLDDAASAAVKILLHP